MSEKTQTTLTGKVSEANKAPTGARRAQPAPRKRLNQSDLSTRMLIHPRRSPSKGPRSPAQERRWQENNRIKEAKRKLACLVDWHDTCPGSAIFPPSSQEEEHFDDPAHPPKEPKDENRIHTSPPKYRETYEKRKPHWDE